VIYNAVNTRERHLTFVSHIICILFATMAQWSLRRKLLIFIPLAIVILAIALGVGLGLTLGGSDDDDDDNSSPPTSTLTPLPTPTSKLPWVPKVNDTWQIILSHPPIINDDDQSTTPDVSIFDIDLFDTPTSTITRLHELGKKVICYFSAGSYENWRPDADQFKPEDLGKDLDGWPGEKWLDLGSGNVRGIMEKRIKMASEKGCDGVDPDNVDGYVRLNRTHTVVADANMSGSKTTTASPSPPSHRYHISPSSPLSRSP
jgi:hypothetical protein